MASLLVVTNFKHVVKKKFFKTRYKNNFLQSSFSQNIKKLPSAVNDVSGIIAFTHYCSILTSVRKNSFRKCIFL